MAPRWYHRPPSLLVIATGHWSSPCNLWNFRRRTRRTFMIRGFVTIASAYVLGTTRRRPQKCTVVAITLFVLRYRRSLQTLPADHSAERLKRQKLRSSVSLLTSSQIGRPAGISRCTVSRRRFTGIMGAPPVVLDPVSSLDSSLNVCLMRHREYGAGSTTIDSPSSTCAGVGWCGVYP